jgi:uncharacterized protein with HEPN domain
MPRDYKVYLEDILEASRKIRSYTEGLSYEAFRESPMVADAVIRNLEVIGEAIKQLPEPLRAQYPDIPWKRIAGLRDILIHAYFGIDFEVIWDLITTKLPDLQNRILQILS